VHHVCRAVSLTFFSGSTKRGSNFVAGQGPSFWETKFTAVRKFHIASDERATTFNDVFDPTGNCFARLLDVLAMETSLYGNLPLMCPPVMRYAFERFHAGWVMHVIHRPSGALVA
jgi:hypothetical protein